MTIIKKCDQCGKSLNIPSHEIDDDYKGVVDIYTCLNCSPREPWAKQVTLSKEGKNWKIYSF